MTSFRLERPHGSVGELHHRPLPEQPAPAIWWHSFDTAALVLGSTQTPALIHADACRQRGIEVVRRRSGGGAVLLTPGDTTWLDVIVPARTSGWFDDVHATMVWLGQQLAAVLTELGVGGVTVHEGGLCASAWSRLICFDGLGPGEVLVDGVKLVGISQRRTRSAARLQACWYSAYAAADLVDLLNVEHRPPVEALAPIALLDRTLSAAVPPALAAALAPA